MSHLICCLHLTMKNFSIVVDISSQTIVSSQNINIDFYYLSYNNTDCQINNDSPQLKGVEPNSFNIEQLSTIFLSTCNSCKRQTPKNWLKVIYKPLNVITMGL